MRSLRLLRLLSRCRDRQVPTRSLDVVILATPPMTDALPSDLLPFLNVTLSALSRPRRTHGRRKRDWLAGRDSMDSNLTSVPCLSCIE